MAVRRFRLLLRGNLTDGEFMPTIVTRMAGVDRATGKHLIAVGMWHEPGHDCPKCPQPREGHLVIHDYLRHQRSKVQAEQVRAAGRAGAAARWGKPRNAIRMRFASEPQCDSDATPNAEVEVEVEVEEELRKSPSVGGSGGDASQQAAPPTKNDAKQRRGTTLPDGWKPSPDLADWFKTNCPDIDHPQELEKFRDYWASVAGAKGRKLDWTATWRNWMRTAQDRATNSRSNGYRPAHVDQRPGYSIWDRDNDGQVRS